MVERRERVTVSEAPLLRPARPETFICIVGVYLSRSSLERPVCRRPPGVCSVCVSLFLLPKLQPAVAAAAAEMPEAVFTRAD